MVPAIEINVRELSYFAKKLTVYGLKDRYKKWAGVNELKPVLGFSQLQFFYRL
jgi:hypothetical protein